MHEREREESMLELLRVRVIAFFRSLVWGHTQHCSREERILGFGLWLGNSSGESGLSFGEFVAQWEKDENERQRLFVSLMVRRPES